MKFKPLVYLLLFITICCFRNTPEYAEGFSCAGGSIAAGQYPWKYPGKPAMTHDGKWLLVPDKGAQTINVVDTGTLQTVHSVSLDFIPASLITADDNCLFVSSEYNGTVNRYDISSSEPQQWSLTKTIVHDTADSASAFGNMVYDSRNKLLYITDLTSGVIRIISAKDNRYEEPLRFSDSRYRLFSDLTLLNSKIFVSLESDNIISVFNTETMSHETDIPVSNAPVSLLADEYRNQVYVACSGAPSIDIRELQQNRIPVFLWQKKLCPQS